MLKPFEFEKSQVALGRPNTYKFYSAAYRMHFLSFESALDSLKSIFNLLRRKPSLGAADGV